MIATARGGRPGLVRLSRDRWLIAYADMITLLLACFAALYASAIARKPVPAVVLAAPAPPVSAPAPDRLVASQPTAMSTLEAALARVVTDDASIAAVELSSDARGIVVSLPEQGSFESGRADPSEAARRMLRDLAAVLASAPNAVRIEGHTDDRPIQSTVFPSNWELSTARATRVVQFLIEQGGLDPVRLSAAGYGPFHPRVPNDSPRDRARNRRVDIVVIAPSEATTADLAGAVAGAGEGRR